MSELDYPGIPVHYYVRLDFGGFRAVVDALGGIEVEVEREIVDDRYPTDDYGYTTIRISAGRVHMNGEAALQYVRTRHGSTDLDRIRRQEQVLVSLLQKGLRPESILRLPQILEAVSGGTDTDLPPEETIRLGLWTWRAGPQAIVQASLDSSLTRPYATADGAQVLLPDWDKIHPLLRELFSMGWLGRRSLWRYELHFSADGWLGPSAPEERGPLPLGDGPSSERRLQSSLAFSRD